MAVSYAWNSGILCLTAEGTYTPEDIPRQFLAGLAEHDSPAQVGLMLDVRNSEVLAVRSPDQIRYVAEFLAPYAERIERRCAVVASRSVHFGLSRMGAVFCEGVGVQAEVFLSPEDAMAWLRPGADPGASG